MIRSATVLEILDAGQIVEVVTKDDIPVQVAIKNEAGFWTMIGQPKKWSSEGLFQTAVSEQLEIHLLKRVS